MKKEVDKSQNTQIWDLNHLIENLFLDKDKVQFYKDSEKDRIESDKKAQEDAVKSLEQVKTEKYKQSENTSKK